MPIRPARRALVAAVATLSLAGLVPAASAQELRYTDARHDVVKLDIADETLTPTPEPGRSNGDITSAYVHYRKGHLVLRLNFAELTARRNTVFEYSGLVRTSAHRTWFFTVDTSPGRYAGHDVLVGPRGRRACEIGHMLDYREDFARVSIDLDCLQDPRWVKVSMGAVMITFDPKVLRAQDIEPGELVAHIDAASSRETDRFGWTPRVHRPRHHA
ncbi:MAG: hypothetical protein HOQ22_09925 [Nocardioidaceae bacterium]|nr:hypothetical protein [Nocardioidaceae bacterium]NUS51341.1 hypothetical protein [Nocardioidaceae bacterium]